jgi:hypothetical protein
MKIKRKKKNNNSILLLEKRVKLLTGTGGSKAVVKRGGPRRRKEEVKRGGPIRRKEEVSGEVGRRPVSGTREKRAQQEVAVGRRSLNHPLVPSCSQKTATTRPLLATTTA